MTFTKEKIEAIGYDTPIEVTDQLELFVYDESNDRDLRIMACNKLDLIYGTNNDSEETDDELLANWMEAIELNGVGKVKLADGWGLCKVCNDAVVYNDAICKDCLKFGGGLT